MLAAILAILAALAKATPTLVAFGDKLFSAWQTARQNQAIADERKRLGQINERQATELASIDADLRAADIERKRRCEATAQAAAQKVIDDAARARSELADAPPAPKP